MTTSAPCGRYSKPGRSGEPLRYEGDFYRFSLMTPFFNPGPIEHPEVPLAIAGVGPYMCKLAGELCQAFHVHPFHTVKYLDEIVLPQMQAGADGGGPLAGRHRAHRHGFRGDRPRRDRDRAGNGASAPADRLLCLDSRLRSGARAPRWDFAEKLRAMSRRGEWAEMAAVIPDDMIAEVAVVAPSTNSAPRSGRDTAIDCSGRLLRGRRRPSPGPRRTGRSS